jgi:hypothetical protein
MISAEDIKIRDDYLEEVRRDLYRSYQAEALKARQPSASTYWWGFLVIFGIIAFVIWQYNYHSSSAYKQQQCRDNQYELSTSTSGAFTPQMIANIPNYCKGLYPTN